MPTKSEVEAAIAEEKAREDEDFLGHLIELSKAKSKEFEGLGNSELKNLLWGRGSVAANTRMSDELRQRFRDMERRKVEGDETKALNEIDRLWNEIDRALNYRPGSVGESMIDKKWGDGVILLLNELRDHIRLEKSVPVRISEALITAIEGGMDERYTRDQTKKLRGWLEPKWQTKLRGLKDQLSLGEEYFETPKDERKRREEKDKAVAAYLAE